MKKKLFVAFCGSFLLVLSPLARPSFAFSPGGNNFLNFLGLGETVRGLFPGLGGENQGNQGDLLQNVIRVGTECLQNTNNCLGTFSQFVAQEIFKHNAPLFDANPGRFSRTPASWASIKERLAGGTTTTTLNRIVAKEDKSNLKKVEEISGNIDERIRQIQGAGDQPSASETVKTSVATLEQIANQAQSLASRDYVSTQQISKKILEVSSMQAQQNVAMGDILKMIHEQTVISNETLRDFGEMVSLLHDTSVNTNKVLAEQSERTMNLLSQLNTNVEMLSAKIPDTGGLQSEVEKIREMVSSFTQSYGRVTPKENATGVTINSPR